MVRACDLKDPVEITLEVKESESVAISKSFVALSRDVPQIIESFARMLGRISYQEFSVKSVPFCPEDLSVEMKRVGHSKQTIH